MYICLCSHSHSLISLSMFTKLDTEVITPKSKNELLHYSLPYFAPKTPILDQEVLKIHANITNKPISASNVCELPKFSRLVGNRDRGTDLCDVRFYTGGRHMAVSLMHNGKICIVTIIYRWIAKILSSYRKLRSRKLMVTSDFRSEVEILPFRACKIKNMHYNAYLWTNSRNSHVLHEKHDSGVRFFTGNCYTEMQWRIFLNDHKTLSSSQHRDKTASLWSYSYLIRP